MIPKIVAHFLRRWDLPNERKNFSKESSSMWYITRKFRERSGIDYKQYWCSDGTRNWWAMPKADEPLFAQGFTSEKECIKEINNKIDPNYLNTYKYEFERVGEMKPKYVISKTNANAAGEKLFFNKNGSSNYWGKLSGEFTRKFSNAKEANERAQELRTQTVNRFTLAVEEWNDVAAEAGESEIAPSTIPTDVLPK